MFFGERPGEDSDDQECPDGCDEADALIADAHGSGDREDGVVAGACCGGVVGVVGGWELGCEAFDGGDVVELFG